MPPFKMVSDFRPAGGQAVALSLVIARSPRVTEAISGEGGGRRDCFAEFILSRMLRFFASLRMTEGEGLAMTKTIG